MPSLTQSPTLVLQQLLTVNTDVSPNSESVLTALELSPQHLTLNVFSTLGIKLAQVEYDGEQLRVTQQLPFAEQTLPPINQVVGDILLSVLPLKTWQHYLPKDWNLVQQGLRRNLLDDKGDAVITILYDKASPQQVVSIQHHRFNYMISIQNLVVEYNKNAK
ncbi:DUF3261 domain-containing protein [Testudinibacter sp. TR-2022]|uniref:DUF3261 domain-containing protein n=1 Tax=Testudinibacter sp. TR-2022 TaxID=2585029 RepID=UPI00159BDCD1|nr:DUF3261 domain-containing protein [Testudinibacter sp. TR-2022]